MGNFLKIGLFVISNIEVIIAFAQQMKEKYENAGAPGQASIMSVDDKDAAICQFENDNPEFAAAARAFDGIEGEVSAASLKRGGVLRELLNGVISDPAKMIEFFMMFQKLKSGLGAMSTAECPGADAPTETVQPGQEAAANAGESIKGATGAPDGAAE